MVALSLITDARVALVWLRATLGQEDSVLIQKAVDLYKKVNEVMATGHKLSVKEADGNVSPITDRPQVMGGSTTSKIPSLPVEINISGMADIKGLEELSTTLELSKVDTINRSLMVYAYLSKEKMSGSKIIFQDKFGIIKKLQF